MKNYSVKCELIFSGVDFDPSIITTSVVTVGNSWKIGERMRPNNPRVYKDSGICFLLLDETSSEDWLLELIPKLQQIELSLRNVDKRIVPLVSVSVSTNGERYPPLFLSREFLEIINLLGAEVDIDVVADL